SAGSGAPAGWRLSRGASTPGGLISADLPLGKRGSPGAVRRRFPECRRPDSPCGRSDKPLIVSWSMNATPIAAGLPALHTKAPRQPMFWAAVAYSSGIVAGVYAWRPALWWVMAGVSFACAAGYFIRQSRSALGWIL